MTAIDVWAQQPNPTFLAQPYFDSLKKWTGMETDDIPLDFPDLKIVGGHIGYPWTTEMIALATRFPNVYIDTSAYVPKRYPHELVEYMKGHGRNKVMFGTNYPMITPETCMSQLDLLELDAEVSARFLHQNAREVFKLS